MRVERVSPRWGIDSWFRADEVLLRIEDEDGRELIHQAGGGGGEKTMLYRRTSLCDAIFAPEAVFFLCCGKGTAMGVFCRPTRRELAD